MTPADLASFREVYGPGGAAEATLANFHSQIPGFVTDARKLLAEVEKLQLQVERLQRANKIQSNAIGAFLDWFKSEAEHGSSQEWQVKALANHAQESKGDSPAPAGANADPPAATAAASP